MGQHVQSVKFTDKTEITLEDLGKGMYFVRIDDLRSEQVIVRKISIN